MPNVITPYDNTWFANRAIERLEKNLMFVRTLYRAYDEEPRKQGSTIEVKKPGGMAAQAMPITTATDLDPTSFNITLDQWYGVAFKVGDKESAYTGEKIINDHIAPAMQALAEQIEASAHAMLLEVGNVYAGAQPAVIADLIGLRKSLNDRSVPKANRYLGMTSEREADLLAITNFLNANEGSDGTATQREGFLGRKFGMDLYHDEAAASRVEGTVTATGTIALNGAVAKGDTTLSIDGSTALTGTFKKGDYFTIAGDSRGYAITADAVCAGNAVTVSISPAARQAYSDGAVVTLSPHAGATKEISAAYQQEWGAIVMAPLSERGNGRGAEVTTVMDPRTNLTIRASRWYEPKDAEEWVRFDALWGVKVLDPDRATRWEI